MERYIKIGLVVVIVVLGWYLVQSIFGPIREQEEIARIEAQRVERLKMIRSAQFAYRELNREFANNWDDLVRTVKHDSFPVIRQIGEEDEEDAVVIRDTTFVSIRDSLFPNFPVDSLPVIPESGGATFKLDAGTVSRGGVILQVFQATDTRPLRRNRVLQVGSMSEPIYSGNWE